MEPINIVAGGVFQTGHPTSVMPDRLPSFNGAARGGHGHHGNPREGKRGSAQNMLSVLCAGPNDAVQFKLPQ